MNFNELNKTSSPSKYSLKLKYPSLDCDVQAIRGLVAQLDETKTTVFDVNPTNMASALRSLLSDLGEDYVTKIVSGDEETCRRAEIEFLARQAAAEMCVNGKYDVETFTTMASLPIADFKLVTKRVMELVSIANDVSNQAMNMGIAGL